MTKKNGFTLIELLVVISIMGILLALSVIGMQSARKSSRDGRRKADIEQIRSALEMYKADCNQYPPSPLGNSIVGNCPTSNTYLSPVPTDPVSSAPYAYNPAGSPPSTYTLTATLEQGGTYQTTNP